MKITEFEQAIDSMGLQYDINLEVKENEFYIDIKNCNRIVADISKLECCLMNTAYPKFNDLKEKTRRDLLDVIYEFASTPIEERQEEKKYYLRHRFLEIDACNYLNYDYGFQDLNLNDKIQFDEIQTQFTQKEIDEIKEKYNTTLDDFEQIEVEK